MSELVIVIVSYNTRDQLTACLRSLHEPAPDLLHEIVVIDNGSTDGSADAARQLWPDVRVIEAGGNIGYARANNLGIRETESDLILLLNSDTSVPSGAVDGLVAELRAHPEAAVAGPRLVDTEGRVELSFGPMMSPLNEVRQKLAGALLDSGFPTLAARVTRRARETHHPDWVSGACLLVRRADATAVGLLDERFFLYGEDVDFCAAIRAHGRQVLFTPAVEIVHARGGSGAGARQATRVLYRRSHLAFYEKHHPGWVPWLRAYLRLRGQLPPF